MPDEYQLVPFTEDRTPAVQAFNRRLLAGGLDKALLYPEHHIPRFPPYEGARLYQEQMLICDAEQNMRGGFILTQELWSSHGKTAWAAHLRLPISEGAVDRRFKPVGPLVFRYAMACQPNLYTVGMGGFQTAVSRRIKSLGWSMAATPFYFQLFHPRTFLRTSPYLKARPATRLAAGFADATGIAGLGLAALRLVRHAPTPAGIAAEQVAAFGDWAGELWEAAHSAYGLIGPRDPGTLNARYPAGQPQFLKLRFRRHGRDIGWAVLLDTQMRGNKYFGDSRVGALADYFARPGDCAAVIHAATNFLRGRGVDLALANQMHGGSGRAFRQCGYLPGPSNYVFAISPKLSAMVQPFESNLPSFFVTRGDGAGPERLME